MEDVRSPSGTAPVIYRVSVDGRYTEVELLPDGTLRMDGRPVRVDVANHPGLSIYSVLVDGASHEVCVDQAGSAYLALVRRRVHRVEVLDGTKAGSAADSSPECGESVVCAPLCGLVVDVPVSQGDVVEAGQSLVIIESMKMENEIRAERGGHIQEVRVKPGAIVREKDILVVLA